MKIHNNDYPNHKTARQWAIHGYLPKEGATGVKLWANSYCQDSYVYYSPDEVVAATAEQLTEYFRVERERRNTKAKIRRQQKKTERQAEIERERKQEIQDIINSAVKPYIERISQLHKIIRTISETNTPWYGSRNKVIVIDTETTGLDPNMDELLQVSIIDSKENILFNSYFKPCAKSWGKAERVNGISPEMVQDAPTISEKIAEINEIVSEANVIIGYSTAFDLSFLKNNGLILPTEVEIIDVMVMFASKYDGKYHNLTTAADFYGYDWNNRPERTHNSLADCYATLYVYKEIITKKETSATTCLNDGN